MASADWDLSPFFPSIESPEYEGFVSALREDVDDVLAEMRALGSLGDAGAGWAALWNQLESVIARFGHWSTYLECRCAADAMDTSAQVAFSAVAQLGAEIEKLKLCARNPLVEAEVAGLDSFVQRHGLEHLRYHLARERERAATSLDESTEALVAELGVDGITAWGRLYDQVTGAMTFELRRADGEVEELPVAMTRTLFEDPDAEVRQATFRGYSQAWHKVAPTVAACLNAISGSRLTLYRRRDVNDFLVPALFDAGISRSTLEAMWSAVRQRQGIAHRYLEAKGRVLGKQQLCFWDLCAPVVPAQTRIAYAAGREQILDAFALHYPALRDFAAQVFDRRWVDHTPRAGKRPGGFCSESQLIHESRIFMTFHGSTGDVQTLAHEIGHAFHSWLMRDLHPLQCNYPMTLAETASTLAENLVTDALLSSPQLGARERVALLDTRVGAAESFLLNIPMRFDFEVALYRRRDAGELSVDELCQLMLEAQRKNYGAILAEDGMDPWFWASKLHFYLSDISFYNFPYTFGYLFSRALGDRFKEEGPSFLPRYEAILRDTGSMTAEALVTQHLGENLERPEFWLSALDGVEADLARFEAAIAAI